MKESEKLKNDEQRIFESHGVGNYSENGFSFRKEAIKITAIYLLFGFLWILGSDELVKLLVTDRNILFKISLFKGLVYVLVTGALIYFLIARYLRKITNRYEEFQKRQILLMELFNSIPDLIFYKDPNSVYLGCNKAFEQFVGKDSSEIIGHTDYELFDKEMANLFSEMDVAMINQKSGRKSEEFVPSSDGHMAYLETLKTPYYDAKENLLGLIGISRDITERKNREEEIFYLNRMDVLTELYNRRFFEEEKLRLDTVTQLPFSIIFADVNGLKLINDSFGYSDGDKMLIETGKVLKKYCRSDDIIARIGGDEFCILLPKTEGNVAKEIIEKIQKFCEEYPIEIDSTSLKLSISFGYAVKESSTENLANTIAMAEDLMRRNKLLNRNITRSDLMTSIKATSW